MFYIGCGGGGESEVAGGGGGGVGRGAALGHRHPPAVRGGGRRAPRAPAGSPRRPYTGLTAMVPFVHP